jgi:hypothetical protein
MSSKEDLWMVGMTVFKVSTFCLLPSLPNTYKSTSPKGLSLAKLITANFHIRRMARPVKGTVGQYAGERHRGG